MRITAKRALFGYSPNAVVEVASKLQAEFESRKRALEDELKEITRSNEMLLEEIRLRKQELSEHQGLGNEVAELLQKSDSSLASRQDNSLTIKTKEHKSSS
jgi:hypothetical protein